jgi:hypothetical protein
MTFAKPGNVHLQWSSSSEPLCPFEGSSTKVESEWQQRKNEIRATNVAEDR